MLHKTIFNTSQICSQLGVKYAVMSPGSRNAPLTISFARNKQIKKFIIPDERSAGFIALGIAQKEKCPVVLCCTSGTALLNYAPAIAEAYYREIPLVVLSADRPPHLIDQRDGQTIRQFEVLKNHVKASFQLPTIKNDKCSQEYSQQLIEGLKLSKALPKGPIHINVPFDEPFYPNDEDDLSFEGIEIDEVESVSENYHKISIPKGSKVLILVGQNDYDSDLSQFLKSIEQHVPVIKSPLNNLQIDGIDHVDGFINNQNDLIPDILITSGLSVLSKKLKVFLRSNKPKKHIHFDQAGVEVDTYNSNPKFIRQSLKKGLSKVDFSQVDNHFIEKWKKLSLKSKKGINEYLKDPIFSETSACKSIINSLPSNSHLHLGNSMPVRFADLFGVPEGIQIWSNRGTSGIDGCSSTAIGSSLVTEELNILFSGDVSFLYDRNAFFHNYLLPNFRGVVFNNRGGGIFRLIEGPSKLPELEDYFETKHSRTAEYICAENEIEYLPVFNFIDLKKVLVDFYQPSDHAKVLEIFTDPATDQKEFKNLKKYINEHIVD